MISVSIILVNYNTPQLTCECIRSINEHVHSCSYEIIVVDNASSSPLQTIPDVCPDVRLIVLDKNAGFGSANNIGVRHACGEYVFLLNTDTILKNDPFPYFMNYMNLHPEIGVVGSFLKNANGEYVRSGGKTYSMRKYLRLACNWYLHRTNSPEVDYSSDELQVGYVLGADMFMRRNVFLQLGGFDERIFMYFEDVELCRRLATTADLRCCLIKGPEIIHMEGGSTSSSFSRIHNTASMIYCFKKEFPAYKVVCFQILYFLLKLPVVFDPRFTTSQNIEYLLSIFNYKKYLNS